MSSAKRRSLANPDDESGQTLLSVDKSATEELSTLSEHHVQYDTVQLALNWSLFISPFCTFGICNKIYITVLLMYMIGTSIFNGIGIGGPDQSYCTILGLCVFSFQIQSLVLYIYGLIIIDDEFKNKFVTALSHLYVYEYHKDNNMQYKPHKLILKQIIISSIIMGFSYISGFFVFLENETDQVHKRDNPFRYYYVIASNSMDLFRYIAQVIHMALITSFYSTFPMQLNHLRKKWDIPSRKNARIKSHNFSFEINQITIDEISDEIETLVYPYYIMTNKRSLGFWIATYMLLNLITVILFWASLLSPLCRPTKVIYYSHYLIELCSFWSGWVFVVIPFYKNQKVLHELVEDIRRMTWIEVNQYNAIMLYLDGLIRHSPVSIAGWKVTLTRLSRIILFVFATIIFDIVAKAGGFKFWGCGD